MVDHGILDSRETTKESGNNTRAKQRHKNRQHKPDKAKGEILWANILGTDGVRGVANAELTPELAFKLGPLWRLCTITTSRRKCTSTRIRGVTPYFGTIIRACFNC